MSHYRLKIFLMYALCIGTVSCWSYSFSEKALPGVDAIAVSLFTDRTNENQIRELLQNSIITTFVDENVFSIVGQNQADAILSGVIELIGDVPTQLNRSEFASQFEVQITVLVKLEEKNSGNVLLSERLLGTGLYTEPLGEGEGSRDAAVNQALEQITRDIIDKISSGW